MDFVRLPFLHPRPATSSGKYLWPGLRGAGPASWCPPDYPFSETEAAAILQELRNLRLSELETMRLILTPGTVSNEWRERDELAALTAFSERPLHNSPHDLARRHAQKVLLWLWQAEEKQIEIAELARTCEAAEARLANNFSENPTENRMTETASPETREAYSWQPCVVNAAYFIPVQMPVFVEGSLRDYLLESQDFKAATKDSALPEGVNFYLQAPIWQILGESKPFGKDRFGKIFDAERMWFA